MSRQNKARVAIRPKIYSNPTSTMKGKILRAAYWQSEDTVSLARDLLGKRLCVRRDGAPSVSLAITETEAYDGPEDLACHASKGKTPRTEVMFGPPGHWYVYLIYGMHEMLNLVTGPREYPAAILIRGLAGISGPGRLTKRCGIDRRFNSLRASVKTGMHVEDIGLRFSDTDVETTPRIGVNYAGPDWANRPYRFAVRKEAEDRLSQSAIASDSLDSLKKE